MIFFLTKNGPLYLCRQYSVKLRTQQGCHQLTSGNVRNMFFDYFVSKNQHKFIRSSPVVPFCDPTVPFVNAGMNQFKNVFLNKSEAPCKSAANSQKCIRVGGKHNDLNVIGTDGYHHTFFEMLGNWSFGDYFKEKACRLAWNLLTGPYMIDPSRLYVTYFEGNEQMGLKPDYECLEIWKSIGVPAERILPFGSRDNFWDMGVSGPCGACTEIHIDHLPDSNPTVRAKYVNAGTPDLTELWNIVFIEYNRNIDGTLEPLAKKYIDTGMGFERLVAILQGKSSNYDTDLFTPIFDSVAKISKAPPYGGVYGESDPRYELDFAYRLVADHSRMCTVCIADGIYPAQNNRLRKILRKTINTCDRIFKTKNLLQQAVVPQIVHTLGETYPELVKNYENILQTFTFEDELYKSVKERNAKEFKSLNIKVNGSSSSLTEDDVIDFAGFANGFRDVEKQLELDGCLKSLSIEYMYNKLYVSYGLSGELIEKIAKEKNLLVNMDEFAQYQQRQKSEAKNKFQLFDSTCVENLAARGFPKTDDTYKYKYAFDTESKLYNIHPIQSKVLWFEPAAINGFYNILLDKTNFYHTAGGQDSDIGQIIKSGDETMVFDVEAVEFTNGYVIHYGHFQNAANRFSVGEQVELLVDSAKRTNLTQHHTAMHLLQAAIKFVTGQIIFQESSHISHSNVKCDLGTIGKRISRQQLDEVEKLIQKLISSKIPIETHLLAALELYAINNLTTVPGAIYPDTNIRVVKIEDNSNGFVSIEPCCGTHASNTSELQDFAITAFKVTSNGTYDITAICGQQVENAKESDKLFLDRFDCFKSRTKDENTVPVWMELKTEAEIIRKDLPHNKLPFVTKATLLAELDEIERHIQITHRALLRENVIAEMVNVLDERLKNQHAFVVHVLNTPHGLEEKLITAAVEVCQDLPVIVLHVLNGRLVHGFASIPLIYSSNKFTAKQWLQEFSCLFKEAILQNKKNKICSICKFSEIAGKVVDPIQMENALERAKEKAKQAFSHISEEKIKEDASEKKLLNEIEVIKSELKEELKLDNIIDLEGRVKKIKNHLKTNLVMFTTKVTCTADLIDIDKKIIVARKEIEKHIVVAEMKGAMDDCDRQPYIVCVMDTLHPLLCGSILEATDLCQDVPIIVINVSNDMIYEVRASIPLKHTNENFTAKHWLEEFSNEFDGKFTHSGTRFDCSVANFILKKQELDPSKFKKALEKFREIMKKKLK